MISYGFAEDAKNNLANNRRMLKGRRDRYAKTKSELFKGFKGLKKIQKSKPKPFNEMALNALKDRMGRTRVIEKWAFVVMAMMVVAFVVRVMI